MNGQPGKSTESTDSIYRHAGAVIAAALASSLYYAIDRTRTVWFKAGAESVEAAASTQIPYFWRIGTSAVIGILTMLIWLRLARRRELASYQWAVRALIPTIGLCALLSLIWP